MKQQLMSPESRVWIYQANRRLKEDEMATMRPLLADFTERWVAHGKDLLAHAEIYHDYFIVLFADETRNPASGCSIDASTRFIVKLEDQFKVRLFDRLNVALWDGSNVHLMHKDDLIAAIGNDEINADALMFNNLVKTKAEFETEWIVPVNKSWLAGFLPVRTG